jgi:hypothetical protein
MPPAPIPWPTTALPGKRPGEGQGDLVNAFATKVGEELQIRRTPGLRRLMQLPIANNRVPRGMFSTGTRLYHAWNGELWYRNTAGSDVQIIGALDGNQPVTFAINIRQTGPQLIIVTELGAFLIDQDNDTLEPYPDAKLPAVTSVEYYAGYFFFTSPTNTIVASDLQDTAIPDFSSAETEYSSDPLVRLISAGSVLYALGTRTVEMWQDVGTSPFPLARAATIDTGILGPWCVAGGANVWGNGVFFVANDYTVRHINGTDPRPISNDDVASDIYAMRAEPQRIIAQVYDFEQQGVFTISAPSWTWEYNIVTNVWHRRDSYGLPFWRGIFARNFLNRWYVQDLKAGRLQEIAVGIYEEDGERLRYRVESAAIRDFPNATRIPAIDIDMTNALGEVGVPSPFGTNPAAMISWSKDGGATWSRPVARSFGRIGRFASKITVNGLGRSSAQGLRIRLDVIDPVPAVLRGGIAKTYFSRAKQVDH